MDIAVVLQGLSLVLLAALLVCVGAFARQLRHLSTELRDRPEERLERRVRERLRSEGYSDVEVTTAIEDTKDE